MELQNQKPIESRLTQYLFQKATKRKIPLSGTFELSPLCNFSCRMCYVRKTPEEVRNHPRKMMTKEQWLRIAEEARKQGLLYLLLTGGEPFIWPDFWELYEKLIEMGFLVSINTNGSMIDDEVVERFKKNPPCRINITLYGASDETYEKLCKAKGVFTKVEQAIRKLKEAGIQLKLNGSLTPYNIEDLEACCQYAEAQKLIYEPVTYMFPPLRRDESMIGQNDRFTPEKAAENRLKIYKLHYGEEAYQLYLNSIREGVIPPPGLDENCIDPIDGKVRCRAGKASFWITWDGQMTPCGMMPGPVVDVSEAGFEEVWEKLTDITEQLKLSSTCATCPNQKLCHSCAAMAMAETGTTEGIPIYLCKMVEAMKKQAET